MICSFGSAVLMNVRDRQDAVYRSVSLAMWFNVLFAHGVGCVTASLRIIFAKWVGSNP